VLKAAIRRLTCKIELVPVLCGSAFKKKGVQPLVDAVVDYLPSPLDVPPAEGHEPGTDNIVTVEASDNNKFCSLAFKLWTDTYAGKLVFFRVYSGQLSKGDTIYNPRTRKRERVSRLDRKSTRLNSSHVSISYAVFCLQKKTELDRIDHLLLILVL